ncbi:hypothetical protein [Glycomyces buryatensis]|uniref:Uncharacterized protein n=1 Tax=Glycomyces buryatensis TaxID=2570927 RepID=A0A4S8PRQ6_9ACTN|nr:hypothetical protein [Glycomyces buryatensis]THV33937.1 hypothetical protein FAB82_24490 [Glycomyces buryatensis]
MKTKMFKIMSDIRYVLAGATITLGLITFGCIPERDQGDPEVIDPSESATTPESTSPTPPSVDFSAEAESMRGWDDLCETADYETVSGQFADVIDDVRSINDSGAEGSSLIQCIDDLELPRQVPIGGFKLWLKPYDSNVAAWEAYTSEHRTIIHNFHDVDIDPDVSFDVSGDGTWAQGEVGAFETPTTKSEGNKSALAVAQGDFYIVEVLMRFDDDEEVLRSDCEPNSTDNCVMTAAYMAEFLADEYLPGLYQRIEDRLAES